MEKRLILPKRNTLKGVFYFAFVDSIILSATLCLLFVVFNAEFISLLESIKEGANVFKIGLLLCIPILIALLSVYITMYIVNKDNKSERAKKKNKSKTK